MIAQRGHRKSMLSIITFRVANIKMIYKRDMKSSGLSEFLKDCCLMVNCNAAHIKIMGNLNYHFHQRQKWLF